MSRAAKITRQISVLMLALVFVSALVLASGLFVFSRGETETIDISEVPLAGFPQNDTPGAQSSPDPLGATQITAHGESSLTILSACLLVVFTVVLLWFLVFRPVKPEAETHLVKQEIE